MNLQQAKQIPITWFYDRVLGLHGTQQTIFCIRCRLERTTNPHIPFQFAKTFHTILLA